ncbi:hypothetical protein PILCRDRAFT_595531 [Piloderma croceum F 1598]|uniref:Uncharacterized protein n=1 Tax=Piloderma croceum (strain F 1598) TaxID=765440 RepID=A0A0C3FEM4_PILCF|nr:hypothetical protein PILCRDRAFT_595531 [Piloderma croceum F 1598]
MTARASDIDAQHWDDVENSEDENINVQLPARATTFHLSATYEETETASSLTDGLERGARARHWTCAIYRDVARIRRFFHMYMYSCCVSSELVIMNADFRLGSCTAVFSKMVTNLCDAISP